VIESDRQRHHRRSVRLKDYDYAQPGAYFVTVCTSERACLFGHVVDGEMRLNDTGELVRKEWFNSAAIRPYVRLDDAEFVVMPNHIHAIVWIVSDDDVGATGGSPLPPGPRHVAIGDSATTPIVGAIGGSSQSPGPRHVAIGDSATTPPTVGATGGSPLRGRMADDPNNNGGKA